MKTEKKIFLEKENEIDYVIDELLQTSASRIILNVPKNSALGESVHNFQILSREAETAGKEIVIESVDEHVLQLASLSRIQALNPVFKTKERAVTDIVPKSRSLENSRPRNAESFDNLGKVDEAEETERIKGTKETKRAFDKLKRREKQRPVEIGEKEPEAVAEEPEEVEYTPDFVVPDKAERKKRRKRTLRKAAYAGSVVVILAAAFFIVTYLIPSVTIDVSIKKTEKNFNYSVMVSTNVATPSFSNAAVILPGQVITAKSNLSLNFTGGTSEKVETKATGTLTVYNDYSSSAQALVATTRFLSPEGKLFRSTERVVVPGAKVVAGKITPSSTEVPVVADAAGADYNVGPSTGWAIPGFEGTAKYGKFYAAATKPMTGGFSGTKNVPTSAELTNAKDEVSQKLESALQNQISFLNSNNLKSLPNSSYFEITSENVTGTQDGSGFAVFAAGDIKQLAFDENMLQSTVLSSVVSPTDGDMKVDNFNVSYSSTTPDFSAGKMLFNASGTITYEPNIDFNALKSEVVGKSADALKTIIFNLPSLEKANVSFWPFWVNQVPANAANIKINVQ